MGIQIAILLSQHSFPIVTSNLNDRSAAIQKRARTIEAQDISIEHMLVACPSFISVVQPAEDLPLALRVASLAKRDPNLI